MRVLRFIAIALVTAAVATAIALVIIGHLAEDTSRRQDVEGRIQIELQDRLQRIEPDAQPNVRDVTCLDSGGPHLKCIATVEENGQRTESAIDVTVGKHRFIWEIR
jgi:hypothetical protein